MERLGINEQEGMVANERMRIVVSGTARPAPIAFPLTPALSLGEREPLKPAFRDLETAEVVVASPALPILKGTVGFLDEAQFVESLTIGPPLPEGEGRGEGEGSARDMDRVDSGDSPRTRASVLECGHGGLAELPLSDASGGLRELQSGGCAALLSPSPEPAGVRLPAGLLDAPAFVGVALCLLFLGSLLAAPLSAVADEMRFPAPEFTSGYEFPETAVPAATSQLQQWIDVGVLVAALSLASWLAIKKRSRKGLFSLMVFSLLYFGFYKQGCVCPIGSIQNVTLSLFNARYAVPLTVLIFFLVPLAFALFFGRVFCSSVCALGAIQDLVIFKPVNLPRKLTIGLSMIPYVYLGVAMLFAATNTGFLICRYDPFIGFFRLNGNAPYLYLGAGFLLAGLFIARPYCRFFCPYGVLLGLMSRFARWHLSITPTECVNCRLCEKSCPFDYIKKPNLVRENRAVGVHRLGYLFVALPLLIVLCGWVGHRLSVPMSRYNNSVRLAENLLVEQANPQLAPTLETTTFRTQGTPETELLAGAHQVRAQMNVGGWLLGGFVGLIFGAKLIGVSLSRTRKDYEVDRAHCFSCGRCCPYCPSDAIHKGNFVPGNPAYEAALALAKVEGTSPEAIAKGRPA